MSKNNKSSEKVLRFRSSERQVHWAISIPFMVCYATALVLVVAYGPNPNWPFREVFSWTHRISGVCLFILPLFVILKSRHDLKLYFYNIKQAWVWGMEDFKFLCLMGLATVNKKIKLPEQGKFNAAEKLNFMILMSTYPLYIITGTIIWITNKALLSWLIHFGMAIVATPFMFGHVFMATLNPETRVALSGMITGYVDRHFVKHHHGKWYKEEFGKDEEDAEHHENEDK
ncbi:MAG: cytochrome b/b6 domain-containing protein [Nitrospirota bacterium]